MESLQGQKRPAPRDLEDEDLGVASISLPNSVSYLACADDGWIWGKTANYPKFNQVAIPVQLLPQMWGCALSQLLASSIVD